MNKNARRMDGVLMVAALGLSAGGWGSLSPDDVLRFGSGARDMAMGRSMIGSARGPAALYWNPALLAESGFREVGLFHAVLPQDFSYSYVGYVHPFKESIGFGAQVLRFGQSGASIQDINNNAVGTFNEDQTAVSLGAGFKGLVISNLDFGLSVDALRRSLGGRSSMLTGLNAGAGCYLLDRRVAVGATAKNVLSMASGQTTDRLPFRLDVGAGYEFLPGATAVFSFKEMETFQTGLEWWVGNRLALRLGDAGKGDFSVGVGVKFQRAGMDFAMTPSRADGLGSTLSSSLSYSFGDDWVTVRRRSSVKYEDKAREQVREGQWVAGVESLRKAVALDPANGTASSLLERTKNVLGAIRVTRVRQEREIHGYPEWRLLRIAMSEHLEGAPLHAQMLVAYASMKRPMEFRYRALLRHFETTSGFEALTVEQKSLTPEAFMTLKRSRTEAFFKERNLGEALRECQEIVLLEPESVQDLERLGSLYFAIGKNEEALDTFGQALKIDPKNASIMEFMQEKGLKFKTGGEQP